jgi:hypothetical protein
MDSVIPAGMVADIANRSSNCVGLPRHVSLGVRGSRKVTLGVKGDKRLCIGKRISLALDIIGMHRMKRAAHQIRRLNRWKTNEIWLLGGKSKSGTINRVVCRGKYGRR